MIVDVVAVNGDLVADLPVSDGRTGPQDDSGGVGTDDVIVQRVALSPVRLLAQSVQERERGDRLEDARPDRVEVDRRRHDRDDDLVVRDRRNRHFVDVQASAGVLIAAVHTVEHRLLVASTKTARVVAGISMADNSSPEAPAIAASRISLIHRRLVPTPTALIAAVNLRQRRSPHEEVRETTSRVDDVASRTKESPCHGSVIVAGSRERHRRAPLPRSAPWTSVALAIMGVLERTGVARQTSTTSFMGQVLQAGQGQITARQAAVKGGIPMSVPGDHHQQGLPLRTPHHLPRRPDDQRR